MVNYANGKIYKIVSSQTDKIYVGSTCEKRLCQRLAGHQSMKTQYEKDKGNYVTSFEILNYDDAHIVLIESYPCKSRDELRSREEYWRQQLKNNIVNDRTAKGHDEDRYEQKRQEYTENHRPEIRARVRKWRKEVGSIKELCECGSNVVRRNRGEHLKTTKHQKYLESKAENVNI